MGSCVMFPWRPSNYGVNSLWLRALRQVWCVNPPEKDERFVVLIDGIDISVVDEELEDSYFRRGRYVIRDRRQKCETLQHGFKEKRGIVWM
jgi:hypothetical protein